MTQLFEPGSKVQRVIGTHMQTEPGGVYEVELHEYPDVLYLVGHDGSYDGAKFIQYAEKTKPITMDIIKQISKLDDYINDLQNDIDNIQITIHDRTSELNELKKEYGVQ